MRNRRVSYQSNAHAEPDKMRRRLLLRLAYAGHFREFFRPTATVSTLPSDSEMALTAALHAEPLPGYEHRYLDRAKNTMRGGAWVTLSGYGIPYIQKLDYDPSGWSKAAPYVMLRKTYDADLGRFRKAFLRSHEPVFMFDDPHINQ